MGCAACSRDSPATDEPVAPQARQCRPELPPDPVERRGICPCGRGYASARPGRLSSLFRSLQIEFGLQAVSISGDRRNRDDPSTLQIFDQTIPRRDVADDLGRLPFSGVTDIVDRDIIVQAPEEGCLVEWLSPTEQVDRGDLA